MSTGRFRSGNVLSYKIENRIRNAGGFYCKLNVKTKSCYTKGTYWEKWSSKGRIEGTYILCFIIQQPFDMWTTAYDRSTSLRIRNRIPSLDSPQHRHDSERAHKDNCVNATLSCYVTKYGKSDWYGLLKGLPGQKTKRTCQTQIKGHRNVWQYFKSDARFYTPQYNKAR